MRGQTTATEAASTATVARDTFPVDWDDPADAELTWRFDSTHFPDVLTPLGYDLYIEPFWEGFGLEDARKAGTNWLRSRHVNGYVFLSWSQAPPPSADPQLPREERLAKLEARLGALAGAGARWHDELLPEIQALAEPYRTVDFDALNDAALAAEIERLRAVRFRQGDLHTLSLRPWMQAMNLLVDTYKELTGGDGVQAARLVQGYGNKSVEAGHALWRLGRLAASIPPVRERLLRADAQHARQVLAEIEADSQGQPFVRALRAFLDEYGWRNDLFELAAPSWVEDSTIPLCQLRAYLRMDGYDPLAEQTRLAVERDAFVAETLDALAPEQRTLLQRVLAAVKDVVTLQEDHNFYIDQRLGLLPRRLILAAARRLTASGLLADPTDVFYLRWTELVDALRAAGPRDLASLARMRREGLAHWATVTPPPFIGAPPTPPPAPDAKAEADLGALDGEAVAVLPGNGGSAGIARGPARILRHLGEAGRLQPGDVLVARTTMPPWTPLFAVAAALVVEVGGVLSHAAVTAREYGLPAVLSVQGATTRIRDGQMVEVDGTRGRVRLLS